MTHFYEVRETGRRMAVSRGCGRREGVLTHRDVVSVLGNGKRSVDGGDSSQPREEYLVPLNRLPKTKLKVFLVVQW